MLNWWAASVTSSSPPPSQLLSYTRFSILHFLTSSLHLPSFNSKWQLLPPNLSSLELVSYRCTLICLKIVFQAGDRRANELSVSHLPQSVVENEGGQPHDPVTMEGWAPFGMFSGHFFLDAHFLFQPPQIPC